MYEEKTPEAIRDKILEVLKGRMDTREGSFAGDLTAPLALELSKMYQALNAVVPMVYVDETSGVYIDKQCANYGLTRKAGSRATVVLVISGMDGTVIPEGTKYLDVNGLEFIAAAEKIIQNGSARVPAQAAEVGEAYNVPAGQITRQMSNQPGVRAVTNEAAEGGTDPESDAALMGRLDARRRQPATSGNAYHYQQWALEVEGVGGAHITPLWNGAGTVKVLVVGPDKGPVPQEVVDACAANIEAQRPIGAAVTVASAQALPIAVAVRVEIDGSTTLVRVRDELEERLKKYLESIAFVRYEVPYSRVGYLLLGIDGVVDYTFLTVNGGTDNVAVGADQVPVIGEVIVT